jgi:methylenetetrahydrofolate dehydrogenase (NADP+)/methenyltetrahydrofolate cyclohydrolase
MTTIIDGNEIGAQIRSAVGECVETLTAAGGDPKLAAVLMCDGGAGRTYVSMKRQACADVAIDCDRYEINPEAPAEALYERIERLNEDSSVNGITVQTPLPDHVDVREVRRRIEPAKDVDGLHPENLGRLLTGDPRYKPCTPHGIQMLLSAYDIATEGTDVVVVGRSTAVGRPTANLFFGRGSGGDATVTVCHSRTDDLAAKTQDADIVVVAAGEPGLIDGEMLSDGAVVIDVGLNRVEATDESGSQVVGDVDYDSAIEKAAAITPVPGGVGPLTTAMLLYNTIVAASRQAGVDVDLPEQSDLDVPENGDSSRTVTIDSA